MFDWRNKPFIYEINTAVWLSELSKLYQTPVSLYDVPDEILDEFVDLRFDAIWLMGVWYRSEGARMSALRYKLEYQHALPNLEDEDVIGSAYSIGAYEVDERLGGREGLAQLRERLRQRNIKLILDYVPNHVSIDHPWITHNTHFLIQGTPQLLKQEPELFFAVKNGASSDLIIAHGRDPHFPGWIDTAQVNAFNPDYREQVRQTLLDLAGQCDGVRCDMAMLVTNDIFAKTWGGYLTGPIPQTEFWQDIIPTIKAHYPDFAFIAEVYWDLEHFMLEQGFDFTYDKRLYDRIVDGDITHLRDHLYAAVSFQDHQIRFIENHDEVRAATALGISKGRAAATLICTLPGATLLYDGQMTGRRVRLPVQLGRGPDEPPNLALEDFYRKLLKETSHTIYQSGEWRMFEIEPAYPGNHTNEGLLAYGWSLAEEFRLVVVNLTPEWSSGVVRIYGWDGLTGHYWRIYDTISNVCTYRSGDELNNHGLRLDVEVYQSQIFRFERLNQSSQP